MDRNELTMAVAGALFGAFLLGWILRWFFGRMNARGAHGATHSRDGERAARGRGGPPPRRAAPRRGGGGSGAAVTEVEAELALTREAFAAAQAQADEVRAAYRRAMGGAQPE